jgi:hypothetical protein
MAIQKQTLNMNFSQGIETKGDPWQQQAGTMIDLQNSVFTKGGMLQKRNGFAAQPSLSIDTSTTLSTYVGNLVAAGTSLNVLSQDNDTWSNRGTIHPVGLSVVPQVRTSSSQTTVDVAVSPTGLSCSVWLDSDANSYYQVTDSSTGQIFVSATQLPSTAVMARVFSLGAYFVITFLATIAGSPHLQFIAIPTANPSNPGSATDISTQVSGLTAGYDGYSTETTLYVSWNGNDGGGAIRTSFIDQTLQQHNTAVITLKASTQMSVTVDTTQGTDRVWVTFYNSATTNAFSYLYDNNLNTILTSTQTITGVTVSNMTSYATGNVLTLFYSTNQNYSYVATRSDYITSVTCTSTGTVGSPAVIARGVCVASKAFYLDANSKGYLMASYGGALQPTSFLIDSSGGVVAKLAYQNSGGYPINQVLPGVTLSDTNAQIGYLFKDQIQPVNKSQGVTSPANIYAQTGINLANFTLSGETFNNNEIGGNLHLTGGFLWMYDGVKPVEHNFHLWPEDVLVTTSGAGGSITAQQYYYYAVYAWTDAQGNIHRSAPSIPYGVTTTGATSTNTVKIPYLRLTAKTSPNKVRIEIYRWSTANQTPYLITSINSPQLNDTTADSLTYTDTAADSAIIGNLILYTTGGVVENIGIPAISTMALFRSRLLAVSAEDPNTLFFSKQVIAGTPVEMSDLFTYYIAPTTGAQGSTGPTTAISGLDDKVIAFKSQNGVGTGIYYFTGNGPDNTGANNDFSDPVFITSSVGCSNQKSIVLVPNGLMFQDPQKGIWLLGRDLTTTYIGAPVEAYNAYSVLSAISVPGTNQIRFTMSNGITLVYDYFYNQWGTFTNIPAQSSTIYQGLHTYLNSSGQVFQELSGSYVDGGNPVLMSFTTAWLNMAGLQGYQRAYWVYLLGHYYTPHILSVAVAYDYNDSPSQISKIYPTNYTPTYGGDSLYGGSSPYGGNQDVEQWRIFLQKQKCESFQLKITEIYDPSYGVSPGQGLSLSGVSVVVGTKSGYPRLAAKNYVG